MGEEWDVESTNPTGDGLYYESDCPGLFIGGDGPGDCCVKTEDKLMYTFPAGKSGPILTKFD